MKNIMSRENITLAVVTLLSLLFVIMGQQICSPITETSGDEPYFTAKVLSVTGTIASDEFSLDGGATTLSNQRIAFTGQVTSGYRKGSVLDMFQFIDEMYAYQPEPVQVGDRILISAIINDSEQIEWVFVEQDRSMTLIILIAVFFGLIVLIGRQKGVATILSLGLTAAVIFMVYVPSILSGHNIYLSTTIVAAFIILMSLTLINGVNKKTACAVLGNIGGVLVAGLLALVMNSILGITGMIEQDYIMLTFISEDFVVDLRAIIWGGIVIGALGAIMDVAMSIASAMNELGETMENRSFARMVRSGMNIGRDAIGTMTNTLILAYIGGSLATVLLLVAYNKNPLYLFNMEMIVVEILQAIVGSMGILFAVPVTVLISAYMFCSRYDVPTLPASKDNV